MLQHPYRAILRHVTRPGRYLGGEFGAVEPPAHADVRVALAFPDAYEIGTSHMGLSILYEVIHQMPGMSAERVFMPWPDMEAQLRAHDLPLLSLEGARPLRAFDLVGFSLQYELTYTNVLAMLELGGIPLRSAARGAGDPIVIAGGPVALQSEPMAPFFDLVLTGDGEEALPAVIEKLAQFKREGRSRSAQIDALAALPHVLAPGQLTRQYNAEARRWVATTPGVATLAAVSDLNAHTTGAGPVPTVAAVFDRFSFEIARGCTEGCRFCQAGFLYRPVRERTVASAQAAVARAVCSLGYDEASLAALSSADHSRIAELVTSLGDTWTPKRVSLAVPSLRAYGLSAELVAVLARLRATGVTLAPEAGTQRLRDVVNKNVSEADLMAAAARFFDSGIGRIKLYFMLGLPTETEEDLAEIVHLSVRLRALGRQRLPKGRGDVVASISTFVPKPFTPFEREPMLPRDEIVARQRFISDLARRHRIDVRTHDVRLSWLEGVLCRGDAALADAIERAMQAGARFDGWDDMFREDIWTAALQDIDTASYLAAIPDGAPLPWDIVDTGITPSFLVAERDAARAAELTAPCGVFADAQGDATQFVCHTCGLKCRRADLPVKPRRAAAPDVSTLEAPRERPARPVPQPVLQASDAPPVRFRFYFSIVGRQMFLGHLDTMRHLMRSLRRAGLDVYYTQGFHPKPRIEAPPPLPLGSGALAEPFDFWLLDPPEDAEIATRLAAALPPDLGLQQVLRLTPDAPKLSRVLAAADYIALVPVARPELEAVVSRLLASDELRVWRERKGRRKEIDVRPFVLAAHICEDVSVLAPHFELSGRTPLFMRLRVTGAGGTRPAEVLASLLPEGTEEPWVVRTRWWDESVLPDASPASPEGVPA